MRSHKSWIATFVGTLCLFAGVSPMKTRVTVNAAPPLALDSKSGGALATPPAMEDAYFDFDRSNIRSDAQGALSKDAKSLQAHTGINFTIEGNCDERGSEEYNLALGERRAAAARDFLVEAGLARARIRTVSFGKDRPVCIDSTEVCWQRNRRVHIQFGSK